MPGAGQVSSYHAAAAGGLAEHSDPVPVAAECVDVVPNPLQRGYLIKQASICRRPRDLSETLDPHAVVERDDDDAALAREATAVVLG